MVHIPFNILFKMHANDCNYKVTKQTSEKQKKKWRAYLLAGIAAIRLLAAVCPFVSLHMVLLDKAHVTLVTAERLFPWKRQQIQFQSLCHSNKDYRMNRYSWRGIHSKSKTHPTAHTHRCGSSHAAGAGTSEWSSCYTDCNGKASHLYNQEYNHPHHHII